MLTIWVSRLVGLSVGKLKSFRLIMCLHFRCRINLAHAPPSTTSPLQGCPTACTVPARVFDNPAQRLQRRSITASVLDSMLASHALHSGWWAAARRVFPPEFPTPYPPHTPPGCAPGLPSFAPRQASSKGSCPVSKQALSSGPPLLRGPRKSLLIGCVLCVGASENKLGTLAALQIKTTLPA